MSESETPPEDRLTALDRFNMWLFLVAMAICLCLGLWALLFRV